MSLALDIRPQARRDIKKIAADLDDYARDAGARFLADVHAAFDRLTTFPGGPNSATRRHIPQHSA